MALKPVIAGFVSVPASGGGSFDPHNPGPIGDSTPSTGAFTDISSSTCEIGNGTFTNVFFNTTFGLTFDSSTYSQYAVVCNIGLATGAFFFQSNGSPMGGIIGDSDLGGYHIQDITNTDVAKVVSGAMAYVTPLILSSYTLATLPAVAPGSIIFVTDHTLGCGQCIGAADSSNWIDVNTNLAVA